VIPDKQEKHVACATDRQHRFSRIDVPALFVLQLLKHDKPGADLAYSFVVDGETREGTTDGDGVLREHVAPGCRSATLAFGTGDEAERDGHLWALRVPLAGRFVVFYIHQSSSMRCCAATAAGSVAA
jgi:hypothetical protein